jgi:hypothetical protein
MLNPELLAAGVAAGVLAGFESPANRLGLGVSAAASLLDSAGFLRLPNKLIGVEGVFAAVGRLANGLLAGAGAGVLVVEAAELAVPNRFVEGAEAVVLSLFCAVAPKLNAGVVVLAFGVPWALVSPPKILF